MDIDSNVIHDSISFRLPQRSSATAMLSCYLTPFFSACRYFFRPWYALRRMMLKTRIASTAFAPASHRVLSPSQRSTGTNADTMTATIMAPTITRPHCRRWQSRIAAFFDSGSARPSDLQKMPALLITIHRSLITGIFRWAKNFPTPALRAG